MPESTAITITDEEFASSKEILRKYALNAITCKFVLSAKKGDKKILSLNIFRKDDEFNKCKRQQVSKEAFVTFYGDVVGQGSKIKFQLHEECLNNTVRKDLPEANDEKKLRKLIRAKMSNNSLTVEYIIPYQASALDQMRTENPESKALIDRLNKVKLPMQVLLSKSTSDVVDEWSETFNKATSFIQRSEFDAANDEIGKIEGFVARSTDLTPDAKEFYRRCEDVFANALKSASSSTRILFEGGTKTLSEQGKKIFSENEEKKKVPSSFPRH